MESEREQTQLGLWIGVVLDAIRATLRSDEPMPKDAAQQEAARRTAWAWLMAQPVEVQNAVPAKFWDATIRVLFKEFEDKHDELVRLRKRAKAPATLAARARFYINDIN